VFVTSRLIRPDLDRMLTPLSSIMATDNMYRNSPEGIFVTKFFIEGLVTRTELESRLQNAISNPKFSVLTQTLENWMGFYFWKRPSQNKSFKLSHQIEFIEEQVVTSEEIKEIHTSLVNKPLTKGRPLWECIVYNNVKPEKAARPGIRHSVIFFRVHQSIADATSFFSIFDELKMTPEYQTMLNLFMGNKKPTMSLKDKIKFGLKIITLGPYDIVVRTMIHKIERYVKSMKPIQALCCLFSFFFIV
jgi:hypothetical protein